MFTQYTSIITSRLKIENFRDDLLTDQYVSWLNDPDTVKFSEQRHRNHTIESCRQYLSKMRESNNLVASIEVNGILPKHIGNLSVAYDPWNKSADVSIMIGDPLFRGGGYGTEAWNSMINYLMDTPIIRRVSAGTMEINAPMLHLFKSSGMNIQCILPKYFLLNGREIGLVIAARYR